MIISQSSLHICKYIFILYTRQSISYCIRLKYINVDSFSHRNFNIKEEPVIPARSTFKIKIVTCRPTSFKRYITLEFAIWLAVLTDE